MLQPVRTKFRKAFKGRINGNSSRAVVLNYGTYGLKALQPERIIGKQIEAARVALTTYGIIGVKVWIYKGELMAKDVEKEKKERVKNATASQN